MMAVNAKVFSIGEANRCLALVRAVVRDIMESWHERESLKRSMRREAEKGFNDSNEGPSDRFVSLRGHYIDVEHRMDRYKKELEELGCYIKDCQHGAVVFPAFVRGELVYLGWLYGEASITHYHRVREPYTKRQPLPKGSLAQAEN